MPATVTVKPADVKARDIINTEVELAFRRMLRTDNRAALPEPVVIMHYRVKRMTDRLQLGSLENHPGILALICVMSDCDLET